jgi:KUP system potassium uptake protein
MRAEARRTAGTAAVAVAALGVVFGDIGTSPIYTVQTAFDPSTPHPVGVTLERVLRICLADLLGADAHRHRQVRTARDERRRRGGGGTMALIAQIRKLDDDVSARRKLLLAGLGVFGAGLFFGDSMITPAISVLSAVEGVETIEPSLDTFIPITVTVLVALFVLQRRGSGAIAQAVRPIMLVWFLTIAALGIRGIAMHPGVLEALSPTYAFDFLSTAGRPGSSR